MQKSYSSGMLDWLLALANAAFFHGGFVYAALITIRQLHASKIIGSVPADLAAAAAAVLPCDRNTAALVALLKLWLMLTALAALSLLGADYIPLFPEMRVIAIVFILLASPATQQSLYERLFEPVLLHFTSEHGASQKLRDVVSYVGLCLMRVNVALGIATMNAMEHYKLLEPAAVREVLSGLAFTRRALQDAATRAEMQAQVLKAMQARVLPLVASVSNAMAVAAPSSSPPPPPPLSSAAQPRVGSPVLPNLDGRYAATPVLSVAETATPTAALAAATAAAVTSPIVYNTNSMNSYGHGMTSQAAMPSASPMLGPANAAPPTSPMSEVNSLFARRYEQWQASQEAQGNVVQGPFLNTATPFVPTPASVGMMPITTTTTTMCPPLSATEEAVLRKRRKNAFFF